jgi:hypothetical protein
MYKRTIAEDQDGDGSSLRSIPVVGLILSYSRAHFGGSIRFSGGHLSASICNVEDTSTDRGPTLEYLDKAKKQNKPR